VPGGWQEKPPTANRHQSHRLTVRFGWDGGAGNLGQLLGRLSGELLVEDFAHPHRGAGGGIGFYLQLMSQVTRLEVMSFGAVMWSCTQPVCVAGIGT